MADPICPACVEPPPALLDMCHLPWKTCEYHEDMFAAAMARVTMRGDSSVIAEAMARIERSINPPVIDGEVLEAEPAVPNRPIPFIFGNFNA